MIPSPRSSTVALAGLLALTGCSATSAPAPTRHSWTPLQAGLHPRVQAAEAHRDVYGLRLGLLGTRNCDMEGLDVNLGIGYTDGDTGAIQVAGAGNVVRGDARGVQLALGNFVDGDLHGIQLAGFNAADGYVDGIQVALANSAELDVTGVQVGLAANVVNGDVDGVQLGLANVTDLDVDGLQVGAYNRAGTGGDGLQIGLFNSAGDFGGVQIGLWNVNESGFVRAFPFFNFGW